MTILLVGLTYQTAPVALRDRLQLSGDDLHHALATLHDHLTVGTPNGASAAMSAELVILSTCNRLEIYASTPDLISAAEPIIRCLSGWAGMSPDSLRSALIQLTGGAAAEHLMRVASGLESLVLGESEIAGQITDALRTARQIGTVGAILSRLFESALHTGKRARRETAISRYTLSFARAAVLIAERVMPNAAAASVLVIGAGQMAESAARAFRGQAEQVKVINRTFAHAEAVAARTGIEALSWDQLPDAILTADVIYAAVHTPRPILTAELLRHMRQTQSVSPVSPLACKALAWERESGGEGVSPLLLFDIAVPPSIDPEVRALPGVCLYAMDDLRALLDDNRRKRESEIPPVEAIIAAELERFMTWFSQRLNRHSDTSAALPFRSGLP